MITPALGMVLHENTIAELWSIWNEFGTRIINKLVQIKLVYFENLRDISSTCYLLLRYEEIECIYIYIHMDDVYSI